MRALLALGLLLAGAGCALRDDRLYRERPGSLFFSRAPFVAGPAQDRCQVLGKAGLRLQCQEARGLGRNYVRRLSDGDDVCLEGGFGEVAGAACLARASVVDVSQGRVLLEVVEAKPDSRWFNRTGNEIWYAEEALVDLYLAERGY